MTEIPGTTDATEMEKCPDCGAELAADGQGGLCRGCLLRIGLEETSDPPTLPIRCPYCHQVVGLSDSASLRDAECPRCGSRFSVIDEMTDAGATIGRFDLLEVIGAGGFGTVWKARDRELDRAVVVKIPHRDRLSSLYADEFLREARAAAQLHHPNIVRVLEVGREDGRVYIASEYIEGLNLAERLRAETVTWRESAELCLKIALALHHAHQAGVVHRDVKPSNIVIRADGTPHITDFGLAKRDSGEISLTFEGKVLGSPAYMSPEQARGDSDQADCRSDVYSLGVVLFEMLTGERPFRGDLRTLLHQVAHQDATSPRTLNRHIPHDLDTICLKCLEKEPYQRYSTADELADDLRRHLEGKPIHARPISTAAHAWRWCQRNPLVAALVASVAILLLVLAIGGPLVAAKEARARKEEATARKQADQDAKRVRFIYRTAEEHYTKAVDLLEDMVVEVPHSSRYAERVASVYDDLAWFLATCPDPKLRDPRHAVELAEMAVRRTPKSAVCWRTLGAARYRMQRWSDSIEALTECDLLASGKGGPEWSFLAMAHWQLGQKGIAHEWYDRYAAWLEQQGTGDVELQNFRDEAALLLGVAHGDQPP